MEPSNGMDDDSENMTIKMKNERKQRKIYLKRLKRMKSVEEKSYDVMIDGLQEVRNQNIKYYTILNLKFYLLH